MGCGLMGGLWVGRGFAVLWTGGGFENFRQSSLEDGDSSEGIYGATRIHFARGKNCRDLGCGVQRRNNLVQARIRIQQRVYE